jgi:MarR-like DNA-binding transcriptional regulator SgrR of sgrS sRNA
MKKTSKKAVTKKPYQVALDLLPGPDNGGFKLANPRCFQVVLALLHHTTKMYPGTNPSDGRELSWTVKQLASACGCNDRTAGRALKQLVEMGWVKTGQSRHAGGEYSGFTYKLCKMPAVMTEAAKRQQQERIEGAKRKALELETSLLKEELLTAGSEKKELTARLDELYEQLEQLDSIESKLMR